jgi:hypothetical protein
MVFIIAHKPFMFSLNIKELQLNRVTNKRMHHLWVKDVHYCTIIHHKKSPIGWSCWKYYSILIPKVGECDWHSSKGWIIFTSLMVRVRT